MSDEFILATDFENIDWNLWNDTLLSSASAQMELILSEVDELIKGCNDIKKPYVQMLEYIYGEVPEFPKIFDIQVPESFQILQVIPEIDKHIHTVNKQTLDAFHQDEDIKIEDLDYVGFLTERHGQKIINTPKIKAYIELIELTSQAHDLLDDTNVEQITNILLYKCYEMCRM